MEHDGADLDDGRRAIGPYASALKGRARLPRTVRAVIFDLDGTLVNTEPCYRAAFHAALDEFGCTLPAGAYDGLVGLPSTARRVILSDLLGPDFPVSVFFDSYRRHRAAGLCGTVALKPGVIAALDMLDEAALPYAIATSASASTASANLSMAGLLSRFATVVTRDDVGAGKPAPDSFLAAAGRLGVTPEHCLAVEDSVAGLTAAHLAGMMVVAVPDAIATAPSVLCRCVAVLGSLHELGDLLGLRPGELSRTNDRSPLRV